MGHKPTDLVIPVCISHSYHKSLVREMLTIIWIEIETTNSKRLLIVKGWNMSNLVHILNVFPRDEKCYGLIPKFSKIFFHQGTHPRLAPTIKLESMESSSGLHLHHTHPPPLKLYLNHLPPCLCKCPPYHPLKVGCGPPNHPKKTPHHNFTHSYSTIPQYQC